MCLTNDHNLKWPGCPPWTNYQEAVILKYDSFFLFHLKLNIIFQQMTTRVFLSIFKKIDEFGSRLFRQSSRSPDLSMRMRIRTTHCGTFILEDLHPFILLIWGSNIMTWGCKGGRLSNTCQGRWRRQMCGVDLCPCLYDGKNLSRSEVCECEVVRGREC